MTEATEKNFIDWENHVFGFGYCAPDVCNCGPKGYEQGRRCPNPFWITR